MSDKILPPFPGLTWPVERISEWSTQVQTAASGDETRVALWSFPRWRWRLKYEVLREAEYRQLLDLFLQSKGKFGTFLFEDQGDNQVDAQPFGTGDGVQTDFQLLRYFLAGGFLEPIRAPKEGFTVQADGVGVGVGAGWTLQPGGIVRFAVPPEEGVGLTWSGGYRFRCRFDMDAAEFSEFAWQLRELGTLEIVSVKK